MIVNGMIVVVIGDGEGIMQIFVYLDLDMVFLIIGDIWDNCVCGGLGVIKVWLVSSGIEENVLCYGNDFYQVGGVYEDIFLYEFVYLVDLMVLEDLDLDFFDELQVVYDDVVVNNLFENIYVDDNVEEYWVEGV